MGLTFCHLFLATDRFAPSVLVRQLWLVSARPLGGYYELFRELQQLTYRYSYCGRRSGMA